jgi:hypothetical protein
MSLRSAYRLLGRRLCPAGLAAAILAAAAASPSGAATVSARAGRAAVSANPNQVIDARTDPAAAAQALNTGCDGKASQCIHADTDPAAAAQALNTGCVDLSNCGLENISFTSGYGPPRILGDVLYNCNAVSGPDAKTATSLSDTRSETTSLSENVSLKLQGGLIGLASTSLDAWASSSQAETFGTTVTTTNQVTVAPGYEGFTTTQVLSANATATYYITRGINLIEVTGVDLSFPGYQDNQDTGDSQVIYNGVTEPINPVINLNYQTIPPCNAVNDNPSTALGGVRPQAPMGSLTLTLCQPAGRCATRTATATPPPAIGRATATLSHGGRTYATGTDTDGRIQLTALRAIRAGKYTLTLRQAIAASPRARRRATTTLTTIVPIGIR